MKPSRYRTLSAAHEAREGLPHLRIIPVGNVFLLMTRSQARRHWATKTLTARHPNMLLRPQAE